MRQELLKASKLLTTDGDASAKPGKKVFKTSSFEDLRVVKI